MRSMAHPTAIHTLERELLEIFGNRFQSLVIYGERTHGGRHGHDAHHGGHGQDAPPTHTLAMVDSMTAADLRACAARVESWHEAGLATPLLIADHEFAQSLDAFPLEFGAILADHAVVSGVNPFASLAVDPADVRRACEVQARSHLLHLREGVLETRGRADALSVLIVRSAAAFAALVTSMARLQGYEGEDAASAARHLERTLGMPDSAISEVTKLAGVHDMSSADAERLFSPYLEAVERIVSFVDGWTRAN
jgi:hypothetical protein